MCIDDRIRTAERPLADAANPWTLLELNGHARLSRLLQGAEQERLAGDTSGIIRTTALDRAIARRIRLFAARATVGDLVRRLVTPSSATGTRWAVLGRSSDEGDREKGDRSTLAQP